MAGFHHLGSKSPPKLISPTCTTYQNSVCSKE